MRKLYRRTTDERHLLGGVFTGLGEWLEVSPGILRVGFIALTILGGIVPGILLYFATMLLIKKHPDDEGVRDI